MEYNTQAGDLKIQQNVYSENELATEYPLFASLNKTVMSFGLYISNLLEAESIRHCIVGDIVLEIIGADTALGHTILTVADDQVAAAGALIFSTDLVDEAPCTFFHNGASGDALPGLSYVIKGTDTEESSIRFIVLPASYLHFNMEPTNYTHNTVLMTGPRCRLPNKAHYADALIHTIVDQTIELRIPALMFAYLKSILTTFILYSPKSFVGLLPPEDQMFLDLIHKVMIPSARRKVCLEWCKIRRGETTVEEARTRIPRKDLAVAKLKAKHEAHAKAAEAEKAANAAKSESEKGYSPVKGKENEVLGVVQPGEMENQMENQMETSALAGKKNEALFTARGGQMENHISTADPISRNGTPE